MFFTITYNTLVKKKVLPFILIRSNPFFFYHTKQLTMKKITRNSVVALFIFSAHFFTLQAQETTPKIATDLDNLLTKSNNYQNYKIIEKGALTNFQTSLKSYIGKQQNSQVELKTQIATNQKSIANLQSQLKAITAKNSELTNDKASINFLGTSVDKANYSTIMWTLFLVTLLVAGFLFYIYKRSNAITKHANSVLRDLEAEFESYRRVCIEREQGLRRQLFETEKKTKEVKKVS